jgi:tRNA1Val (adenine37-N6)-methyltransferase
LKADVEHLINGYMLLQREPHEKLGMDSVFLSRFLHPSKTSRICDLGCGSGALTILLAARYSSSHIDGVDIQRSAVDLLEENIALNSLGDRVHAIHADLRKLDEVVELGGYPAVICNPPYFKKGAGKAGALHERRIARSEETVTIDDICLAASRLIKNGGEFAVVYRSERLCDLMVAMRKERLEPKRLQYIHHTVDSEPKLILVAGRKNAGVGLRTLPPLIVKNPDGSYSEDYLAAYRDEAS